MVPFPATLLNVSVPDCAVYTFPPFVSTELIVPVSFVSLTVNELPSAGEDVSLRVMLSVGPLFSATALIINVLAVVLGNPLEPDMLKVVPSIIIVLLLAVPVVLVVAVVDVVAVVAVVLVVAVVAVVFVVAAVVPVVLVEVSSFLQEIRNDADPSNTRIAAFK